MARSVRHASSPGEFGATFGGTIICLHPGVLRVASECDDNEPGPSDRESLLEVMVARVNGDEDVLGELDGTLVHVTDNPALDITPSAGDRHVIEVTRLNGLITGEVTGFSTLEGMERFDTPEEEKKCLRSPAPGDCFEGTVDRIDDENRVIEVNSAAVDSILLGRGDPGDEVVVRLNRKSGDRPVGRVISNRSADPRRRELTEEENQRVRHRYETPPVEQERVAGRPPARRQPLFSRAAHLGAITPGCAARGRRSSFCTQNRRNREQNERDQCRYSLATGAAVGGTGVLHTLLRTSPPLRDAFSSNVKMNYTYPAELWILLATQPLRRNCRMIRCRPPSGCIDTACEFSVHGASQPRSRCRTHESIRDHRLV